MAANDPLAGGLWQSAPAQDLFEFLLRERVNPAFGVRDGLFDQCVVGAPSSPGERLAKSIGHRDALLHGGE